MQSHLFGGVRLAVMATGCIIVMLSGIVLRSHTDRIQSGAVGHRPPDRDASLRTGELDSAVARTGQPRIEGSIRARAAARAPSTAMQEAFPDLHGCSLVRVAQYGAIAHRGDPSSDISKRLLDQGIIPFLFGSRGVNVSVPENDAERARQVILDLVRHCGVDATVFDAEQEPVKAQRGHSAFHEE